MTDAPGVESGEPEAPDGFAEPADLADPAESGGSAVDRPAPARRTPGGMSLLGAIGCLVIDSAAVVTAVNGGYLAATVLAQLAIVVTVAAFAAGLYAAVSGRGRRAGIVGASLSVLANPLALVAILAFLGAD